MSRKKRGGLFARPSDLSLVPPDLPTGRKEKNDPVHSAYCPLAQGYCSDVQCGKCALIDDSFEEYIWVCSTCTDGLRIEAYYADSKCAVCGSEFGILMLGVPR